MAATLRFRRVLSLSARHIARPSRVKRIIPLRLFARWGHGLAEGLNWGNCSSYTVNSAVPDYGGFNWLILGPAPPNGPSPVEATTEAYGVALDPVGDVFVVGGSDTASLSP